MLLLQIAGADALGKLPQMFADPLGGPAAAEIMADDAMIRLSAKP